MLISSYEIVFPACTAFFSPRLTFQIIFGQPKKNKKTVGNLKKKFVKIAENVGRKAGGRGVQKKATKRRQVQQESAEE